MTILHHALNTVLMTTKLINNVLPSKRERERERGREREKMERKEKQINERNEERRREGGQGKSDSLRHR